MKDKVLYRKRMFLNPSKDSNAFINAMVERWTPIRDGSKYETSGDIAIGDCGRIIHLDVFAGTKREKKNTLKKLDNLIDVLSEVRDVVDAEEV